MSDRRHANANWRLHINGDGTIPADHVKLALLMDLRDELRAQTSALQTIARAAQCPNVRRGFVAMHKLRKHLEALFPERAAPKRRQKKPRAKVRRRRTK